MEKRLFLDRKFFERSAKIIAKELLGKILIRQINGFEMMAKIVETEAYFDDKDPASRACQNGDLRKTMEMEPGTILVYGVHNNWMLNFVTGKKGKAEAVLLRALRPLNFEGRCNGPGLLTKEIGVDKRFHKKNIFDNFYLGIVDVEKESFEIIESFRIGVKKDLPEKLRFYIKGDESVSRT